MRLPISQTKGNGEKRRGGGGWGGEWEMSTKGMEERRKLQKFTEIIRRVFWLVLVNPLKNHLLGSAFLAGGAERQFEDKEDNSKRSKQERSQKQHRILRSSLE